MNRHFIRSPRRNSRKCCSCSTLDLLLVGASGGHLHDEAGPFVLADDVSGAFVCCDDVDADEDAGSAVDDVDDAGCCF